MAQKKKRLDTSFNFGALAKPTKKAGAGKRKRPKGAKSKSRKHFGTAYGS